MTSCPTHLDRIQRQIIYIETRLEPLRQQSYRLSWLRVATFLLGVAASFTTLAVANPWLFAITLLLSIAAFIYVIRRHQQLDQVVARFVGWQQIKREQLARAKLDWSQIPAAAPLASAVDHPFADDLDLSGERSLHRLLDGTITHGGSQRLYDWLTTTQPDLDMIVQRQQLVGELKPMSLWRTRFLLDARVVSEQDQAQSPIRLNLGKLLTWFQLTPVQSSFTSSFIWELPLSFLLLGLTGLFGVLFLLNLIGSWWQLPYLLYFLLQLVGGQTTGTAFANATSLQAHLEQLVAILHHVEEFGYQRQPHLRQFCTPILDQPNRPSQLLRRIRWIVGAIGVQSNPVVGVLCNAIFPWNLFFAKRLAQVKSEAAQGLPTWLEKLYDLDALNALATFAYLHPAYTFPKIVAVSPFREGAFQGPQSLDFAFPEGVLFSQLGHPLIAHAERVRNDFCFEELGTLALITGSNMAGKSAFLRAIGLNLALAFAGSVVDASEMRTPLLRLFTSIKISDSVTQGVSYFYAEVKRLKRLLDALHESDPRPLLFCIDEIFRGTNNRERLIGSRSYIRQVVGNHGVGLISTHDLDLVTLADEVPQIHNYHFRDAVVDGEMVFDYTLHPGPCPTTNALKVMRSAGLPVDE